MIVFCKSNNNFWTNLSLSLAWLSPSLSCNIYYINVSKSIIAVSFYRSLVLQISLLVNLNNEQLRVSLFLAITDHYHPGIFWCFPWSSKTVFEFHPGGGSFLVYGAPGQPHHVSAGQPHHVSAGQPQV